MRSVLDRLKDGFIKKSFKGEPHLRLKALNIAMYELNRMNSYI